MALKKTMPVVAMAGLAVGLLMTSPHPAVGQQSGRSPEVSDTTVRKTGQALRQISQVRQDYSQRVNSAATPDQKQALQQQAESAQVQAVTNQGLTVDEYNHVVQLAQADPTLKQRLLTAAEQGR